MLMCIDTYGEKQKCIDGSLTTVTTFYPRDAMLARSLRQRRVRLSVRLSVCHTPVLCLAERKQDSEMYTI